MKLPDAEEFGSDYFELHMLFAYPPGNPNRGETGRPKEARLGGTKRMRISSQCLKRHWRTSDTFQQSLNDDQLGVRTKEIGRIAFHALVRGTSVHEVAKAFAQDTDLPEGSRPAVEEEAARDWAEAIAKKFGKTETKSDSDPNAHLKLKQLVAISNEELDAIDEVCQDAAADRPDEVEIENQLLQNKHRAVDLAFFGRMVADDPDFNIEGATQVSHAITTHPVKIKGDDFTAVDELQRASGESGEGAGHLGTKDFGAGVFYKFLSVNYQQLLDNLDGDHEAAQQGMKALVRAALTVTPSGMENSFGTSTHADYARGTWHQGQPNNLAAAFYDTRMGETDDQLQEAISRLEDQAGRFNQVYDRPEKTSTLNVPEGEGSLDDLAHFAASNPWIT